jgi:hypothetical protein
VIGMKCLVKGCNEHCPIDGEYVCPKYFVTLVTGFVGEGTTFIHDLKAELLLTSALIDRKAVIIAMAIDEQDIENDFLIDRSTASLISETLTADRTPFCRRSFFA